MDYTNIIGGAGIKKLLREDIDRMLVSYYHDNKDLPEAKDWDNANSQFWNNLQKYILDNAVEHKKGRKYPKILEIYPDFGKILNESNNINLQDAYFNNTHNVYLTTQYLARVGSAINIIKKDNKGDKPITKSKTKKNINKSKKNINKTKKKKNFVYKTKKNKIKNKPIVITELKQEDVISEEKGQPEEEKEQPPPQEEEEGEEEDEGEEEQTPSREEDDEEKKDDEGKEDDEEENDEKKKKKEKDIDCNNIIQNFNDKIKKMKELNQKIDFDYKDLQSLLKCKSKHNKEKFDKIMDDEYNPLNLLYPHLDDTNNFNIKIALKKEFFDTQYPNKTDEDIKNIEEKANTICNNREFELEPHQRFVRNYLSFNTPYNSLLLFHGLGSGKTCSSIQVCEDMRSYLKLLGIKKKILIVASPVVQENFKLQLFDERKLEKINGIYTIKSCVGNKFIKELNPMNTKNLNKYDLIKKINKLIKVSYEFMGYTEFANYIDKIIKNSNIDNNSNIAKKNKRKKQIIQKIFSNKMIVIDEVHNLRDLKDSKRTTKNIKEMVKYSQNLKLLILTATPMFNSHTEIIWLLNFMNLNDNRYTLKISDVFKSNGDFEEGGEELLIQKATGYISYIRSENPFLFPYRIYPELIEKDKSKDEITSLLLLKNNIWDYPLKQINDKEIKTEEQIQYLDLAVVPMGEKQYDYYKKLENDIIDKNSKIFKKQSKGLSYVLIESLIQNLNISYPRNIYTNNDDEIESDIPNKIGLIMNYNEERKNNYEYKKFSSGTIDIDIEKKFGRIFSIDKIGMYSGKIHNIMKSIQKSKGIVLIYSQYIDNGCVPLALALEEMGLQRYNGNNLFKNNPGNTFTVNKEGKIGKYVMITGNTKLSPNNKNELKACTSKNNINGENVKVIIISRSGTEGLDFKNIRQIHIMEPWYNINRIDQTTGRGIRNLSHCQLPYNERNVELYLYASRPPIQIKDEIEPADLYMYRIAEKKGIKIGKIRRILKETAIDCLLNENQTKFTEEKMNKTVKQVTSTGVELDNYSLGDKNNSIICDFTNCDYECKFKPNFELKDKINTTTYNKKMIVTNLEKIIKRIRLLFNEKYFYEKKDLFKRINYYKDYSKEQIYAALNLLINDDNEMIEDTLGRKGYLINVGDYYMFSPSEIKKEKLPFSKIQKPISYKNSSIQFNLKEKTYENTKNKDIIKKIYKLFITLQNEKSSKNKWLSNVYLVINNLNYYHNINKNTLKMLAFSHLLDELKYQDKLKLIEQVYVNKVLDNLTLNNLDVFRNYINYYFENIKLEYKMDNNKPVIAFNVIDNNKNKSQLIFITPDRNVKKMQRLFDNKFKTNVNNIPPYVGFMIYEKKNDTTVFKSKKITGKNERKNKGEKNTTELAKLIKDINMIFSELLDMGVKYELNKNVKFAKINSINAIVNDTISDDSTDKKNTDEYINSITPYHLYIEKEMLFRILDYKNIKNKKWFFNSVENNYVKVEKI